jgi:hypothetical protein
MAGNSVMSLSLRDNPVGNFLFGAPPPQQPGVGNGQDVRREDLVPDPSTGMFFDPKTGQTFTDPYGNNVVTDPNVAQQVAANFNTSKQFLTRLGNVQGNEDKLVGQMQGLINGSVPSVAQTQLGMGQNALAAQQLSQAAGVGGAAGPLAQLLAARNTALGQIGMNQQAGLLRAQEQQQNMNSLASLLGGMANQNLAGAGQYSQLAASGQAGQQGLNEQTSLANQDFMAKLAGAGAMAYAGGAGAKAAGGG